MSLVALIDQNHVVQNVCVGAPPQLPTGWIAVPVPPNTTVDIGYTFTAPSTFTFGQTTAQVQQSNLQTLQAHAQAALTVNANFLGIASPVLADLVAQVQALTRENTALIRLLLQEFDSTANT